MLAAPIAADAPDSSDVSRDAKLDANAAGLLDAAPVGKSKRAPAPASTSTSASATPIATAAERAIGRRRRTDGARDLTPSRDGRRLEAVGDRSADRLV